MGELTRSFGSRHHSTCKSSRTARVGVWEHGNQIIGKRCRIERLAIVDDKHVEVVANRTALFGDARFNELDVGNDKSLIFKRCRRQSEVNTIYLVLIHGCGITALNQSRGSRFLGGYREPNKVKIFQTDTNGQRARSILRRKGSLFDFDWIE